VGHNRTNSSIIFIFALPVLSDFAVAVDEKSRRGAERAVLQGGNSDRSDGRQFDLRIFDGRGLGREP
jgi:hypothetical protein